MELLSDVWNNKISSSDFIKFISDIEDYNKKASVISDIFSFLSDNFEISISLVKCCVEILINFYEIITDHIDTYDEKLINSIRKLLIYYGDQIGLSLKIGDKMSSLFGLKLLEICLKSDTADVARRSIEKLCYSPNFSVLIASCRIFCKEEYLKIRELFNNSHIFSKEMDSRSIFIVFLRCALTSDFFTNPKIPMFKLTIKNLVVSTFCLTLHQEGFFHNVPSIILQKIYVLAVSCFYQEPNLIKAYIITCLFFVRIKQVSGPNNINEFHLCEFNRDLIREIIQTFPSVIFSLDPSIPISMEQLISFICSLPDKEIHYDSYISLIYKYPGLSVSLCPLLIDNLNSKNIDFVKTIFIQLIGIIQDFIFLVSRQGLLLSFLGALHNALKIIDNIECFSIFWDIFTGMIKMYRILFNDIETLNSFIDTIENDTLQCFLRLLIDVKVENIKQVVPNKEFKLEKLLEENLIYDRCIIFINICIHISSESQALQLEDLLVSHIYLLIIYTTIYNPFISIANLTSKKLKFNDITQALFENFILSSRKKNSCNLCLDIRYSFTDIMIYIEDFRNLAFALKTQVNIIISQKFLEYSNYQKAILVWKYYILDFGVEYFINQLLYVLITLTKDSLDCSAIIHCYTSCFYFLKVAIDMNQEIMKKVLRHILTLIENSDELICNADCSSLSVSLGIIFVSLDDDNRSIFDDFINFCSFVIEKQIPVTDVRCLYAISIIKTSIFTPCLNKFIPVHFYQLLLLSQDLYTAIDFFITKSDFFSWEHH